MYTSLKSEKGRRSPWRYLWRSEDVRRKILVTIGLVLLFRFLLHIPLPSIEATPDVIRQNITPGSGLYTFLDFLSILSGSSLLNVSVLSLGLLPYNLARTAIQLIVPIVPSLQRRSYEDPRASRRWQEEWNYFLAFPLAVIESFVFFFFISPNCSGRLYLLEKQDGRLDLLFTISTVLILTAGSFFSVWIAELISEYGIRGQGMSILILSGIIGRFPEEIVRVLGFQAQGTATLAEGGMVGRFILDAIRFVNTPEKAIPLLIYVLFLIVCLYVAIHLLLGRRNVPVMYPGRSDYRKLMSMSKPRPTTYLPLMLSAGREGLMGSQLFVALATFYAPLISCATIPWVNGLAMSVIGIFDRNNAFFSLVVFPIVVAYTYFYSDLAVQQQNYGENLKRTSAYIPGVKPGDATDKYIRKINNRLTLVPSLMLGFLAIAPSLFSILLHRATDVQFSILDGECLLIVVSIIWDVLMTINAELRFHGYQGGLPIS